MLRIHGTGGRLGSRAKRGGWAPDPEKIHKKEVKKNVKDD
jgi:hypothetical protein